MTDFLPRWLSPEQAAPYVGRRVDELPRLVKAGKLPPPSFHFGPRSPRYDRLALDALFQRGVRSHDVDQAIEDAADEITRRNRIKGKPYRTRFSGRPHPGLPAKP